MKKLIRIPGELTEKGSVANKLAVKAAKEGKDLTAYIEQVLIKDSKK
jgi:hypothetical protein